MSKSEMRTAINTATAAFLAKGNHIRKLGSKARNYTEAKMRAVTRDEVYSLAIEPEFDTKVVHNTYYGDVVVNGMGEAC